MEMVKIVINKERNDIIITSSEGQKITITESNKELKATETIEFLNYTKDKSYHIEALSEELKKDKNIVSIYMIFKEIVEKLNPISSEDEELFEEAPF